MKLWTKTLVAAGAALLMAGIGFADTLDMRDFASLRPRTQGPLAWWLESPRRLRHDATKIRDWMEKN